MSNRKIAIGVDIGGSHVSALAVDFESGKVLPDTYCQFKVDSHGPADRILQAWKDAISGSIGRLKHQQVAGIGFAMPGPFDYPNGIALFRGVKKFDSLYGVDVMQEMKTLPGLWDGVPVRFMNDATCFAIGEAWLGGASQFRRVVAITLGTGFGSAFLEDGVPVTTGDGVPMHGWVYHLPFGDSIADDHFSTRWFIKRYHEMTGLQVDGVKEIADRHSSDLIAQDLFHEFGTNLANFLAPLLENFRAECLVIGGNIALGYDHFGKHFSTGLAKSGMKGLHIYCSGMGEKAAIAGSARLCDDDFYNRIIG